MRLQLTTIVLFVCLIFTAGCDITFKRKSKQVEKEERTVATEKKVSPGKPVPKQDKEIRPASAIKVLFSKKDADLITSYFSSEANAIIRKNMIKHSAISKMQEKKLDVGKIIPRDFQVIPLPLKLERVLTTLDLRYIRVQVGVNIILMNVKTRQILDIIKI